jgi:apolipoprotein N-acyltransferase
LQLASIAGIWGITFVMLWLAPVANNLWRSGWSDGRARAGVAVYGLVLGAVVLFGSSRLVFFAPSGGSLRVASVTPPEILDVASPEDLQPIQQIMMKQEVDEAQAANVRAILESTYERLFEDTRREARAGADLVVWPEGSLISFDEERDEALIEQGRQLASEEEIYLAMTIALLPGASGGPNENRLILLSPAGEVVQTYWKHHTVPVIEEPFALAGSQRPFVHETASTALGGVICYDMDSPRFIRSAGRDGVDVLLAPSGDWPAIKELHSRMALVRAVEQGFSLVRPANHGLNLVTDYQGRVLGRLDHYATSDRRLSAAVPERGVTTVYQRTGDALPWLCLALTVLFLALLLRHRARPRRSSATATGSSRSPS